MVSSATSGWSVDVEKCSMAHMVHTVSLKYIYVLFGSVLSDSSNKDADANSPPSADHITFISPYGNRSQTSLT